MKSEELKNWFIKNEKLYFTSIELTQNCNFKCRHCYCADKESKNLSFDEYKNIIDKIYSTGCLFLNFTGGEIFTHKYFNEIYSYAKNKGFIIDLLTNASLLSNDLIKLFKKLPPNNIAITIYGTSEYDYLNFTGDGENFNRTMKALKLLKDNNIPFVLRTVATKTLKNSLMRGEFEKIADDFGTTFKYDPIIFPKTTGNISQLSECMDVMEVIELEKRTYLRKEAWEEAIKSNKKFKWTCEGGTSSMAIDFEGNAFICGLYRKKPISLIKNDIDIVLKHLKEIHQEHIKIVESNECSVCDRRNICKWCPAYSSLYNKNESEKIEFFCKLSKERKNAFGRK
ncbi:TPA: radical SAM protein [Clostridium perfringens]|nr:radical SAM protein [Clostridium perfringens]